jgi:hypothetical protein
MKYDIFKFERELVLNAALKIISDSQIKSMGLPEIAYFSGLAEGTVRKIFHSTEIILSELTNHITDSISANTEQAIKSNPEFKDQFKSIWHSMFNFYQQNPQVLAFMQSTKNIDTPEIEIIASIVNFFKRNEDSISVTRDPELLALIFHSNIITAAKISLQTDVINPAEKISFLPDALWSGLIAQDIADRKEAGLLLN